MRTVSPKKHTIHRDYCPHCKKIVEPAVPDAMPGATIGHRTIVFSAFLHYFIGVTISRIVEIFSSQFYFKLTPCGLVPLWHNLVMVLQGWYDQIREEARNSAVLHADETGWRVNGITYWLWCFTNQCVPYYVIDKSRASPVVKRILRDAMRLCGRNGRMAREDYERLCARIEKRLTRLLEQQWKNVHVKRLVKRLKRHRKELFVFLYHDGVPFDNNHAERTIRNGVVMRKNSDCNRSIKGAETQGKFMSIFATLKQRGYHGTKIIVDALREYVPTKILPKLDTVPSKRLKSTSSP